MKSVKVPLWDVRWKMEVTHAVDAELNVLAALTIDGHRKWKGESVIIVIIVGG